MLAPGQAVGVRQLFRAQDNTDRDVRESLSGMWICLLQNDFHSLCVIVPVHVGKSVV